MEYVFLGLFNYTKGFKKARKALISRNISSIWVRVIVPVNVIFTKHSLLGLLYWLYPFVYNINIFLFNNKTLFVCSIALLFLILFNKKSTISKSGNIENKSQLLVFIPKNTNFVHQSEVLHFPPIISFEINQSSHRNIGVSFTRSFLSTPFWAYDSCCASLERYFPKSFISSLQTTL